MGIRVTGESITTTLTIQFTDGDNVTTRFNADSTPTAKIYLSGTLVDTLSGSDITNSVTGVYSISWTASSAGQYQIVWSFTVSGIDYTQDEDVFVLAAASTSVTPEGTPDIGTSSVCLITGTFIDAGGNYKQGVHIRFSPTLVSEYNTTDGFIIDDVTTESNSDGQVSFYLKQGIKGLLTIAGTGIVRQVTVPEESTKDIFDLVSEADDLLEVQNPDFYEVIKRS